MPENMAEKSSVRKIKNMVVAIITVKIEKYDERCIN